MKNLELGAFIQKVTDTENMIRSLLWSADCNDLLSM